MQYNIPENWKETLLKSGLPLESSVRNIIKKLNIAEPLEYNFLRKNIEGNTNNFSIDILARKVVIQEKETFNGYEINYLIECKYCSKDSNWIFMPHPESYADCNFSLYIDFCDTKEEINDKYFDSLYDDIEIVGKGTSLRNKNSDPTQIKEAYNQLSYAYLYRLIDKLRWGNTNTYFMVPIIVTTANLLRLKEEITVEEIEKAKDIEDICTKHDILFMHSDPDELMKKYFFEQFDTIDETIKRKLEREYYKKYAGDFHEEIDSLCTFAAGRFFIINYYAFEKELKKIDDGLSNPIILKKRTPRTII